MKEKCQLPARLTGNQLKLLAMLAMTCDHVGLQLFPELDFLRWIGRLAMPLYAYMIAEGCRYTRNRKRYFMGIALLGLVCQLVYFFAMGSLYQCILVTFSLSILLIYLLDNAKGFLGWVNLFIGIFIAWFLSSMLPEMLAHTDFRIDYDMWGIALPVLIYLGKNRKESLLLAALGLVMLGINYGGEQWLGLLALIPLAFYDGTRGKARIKWLFYLYYPAHLVIIYLLSMIFK